jgi:predicted transglutaminase-like cysteine proteinase
MAKFFAVVVLLWGLNAASLSYAFEITPELIEKVAQDYGEYAKRRLVGWQKLLQQKPEQSDQEKLQLVNDFFNLIPYLPDIENWGQQDYWASPLEFLVAGAGDCEDYSIAKYFSLLALGMAEEKLMITYAKAIDLGQAHMVLTYYATPSSMPLVLDNLIGDILPADQRQDLTPIYSFNGSGLWSAKQRGLGNKLGAPNQLNLWADLVERMDNQEI